MSCQSILPCRRRPPQGRLTVNYRYTHRKFQLKFSALLKDYDLKYAENSKKILLNHPTSFNVS